MQPAIDAVNKFYILKHNTYVAVSKTNKMSFLWKMSLKKKKTIRLTSRYFFCEKTNITELIVFMWLWFGHLIKSLSLASTRVSRKSRHWNIYWKNEYVAAQNKYNVNTTEKWIVHMFIKIDFIYKLVVSYVATRFNDF